MNDTVRRAHRIVRGHTAGDLQFDEHMRPVRYVVCPDGRLAAPAMVAMFQSVETVLFVPSCEEGALELLITLDPFEETGADGATADRWRIYHGEPEDVRWAYLDIDAGKLDGAVIDGGALMVANPLADAEPSLCREMNGQADLLRSLCKAEGHEIESPTMVGADPDGVDVRGHFGVIRVPFDAPVETADELRSALEARA